MNSTRVELLRFLADLSAADPDLRFGQMLANLATLAIGAKPEAVWDVEDKELLEAAKRLLHHYNSRSASAVS